MDQLEKGYERELIPQRANISTILLTQLPMNESFLLDSYVAGVGHLDCNPLRTRQSYLNAPDYMLREINMHPRHAILLVAFGGCF